MIRCLALLVGWLLLAVPTLGEQLPLDPSIPDTIRQVGGGMLWVSEEAGSLSALSDDDRAGLADFLESSPPVASFAECKPYELLRFNNTTRTADDLLDRAHYIAHVAINGTKPGFYRGRPGELLDVSVIELLKDSGRVEFEGGFYLFHEYARTVVSGQAICVGEPLLSREYLFFLAHGNPRSALPICKLHTSSLVSLDQSVFHGNLFKPRNPQKEIPALFEKLGL